MSSLKKGDVANVLIVEISFKKSSELFGRKKRQSSENTEITEAVILETSKLGFAFVTDQRGILGFSLRFLSIPIIVQQWIINQASFVDFFMF